MPRTAAAIDDEYCASSDFWRVPGQLFATGLREDITLNWRVKMATRKGGAKKGARKSSGSSGRKSAAGSARKSGSKSGRKTASRSARKSGAKKASKRSGTSGRKSSGKRELIAPKGDKRYTRRTASGAFAKNQDDVGKSLSRDVKKKAKTRTKAGQGDKGDRTR